jgi:maltose phosphorylase
MGQKKFRNGAIAFAFTITIDTGLQLYPWKGFEVLIAIARFWHQRATFSTHKTNMLFWSTGPNEYENNVNNNFLHQLYCKWCLEYTYDQIQKVFRISFDHKRITEKVKITIQNCNLGKKSDNMYLLFWRITFICNKTDFRQRAGTRCRFRQITTNKPKNGLGTEFYVRLIKQDVLQCFYFLKIIKREELKNNLWIFYQFMKVPYRHASPIQAALLDKMDMAYTFTYELY